jgi:hypothetical protein
MMAAKVLIEFLLLKSYFSPQAEEHRSWLIESREQALRWLSKLVYEFTASISVYAEIS